MGRVADLFEEARTPMTAPNRYLSVPRYRVLLCSHPSALPGWMGTYFDKAQAEAHAAEAASRMLVSRQPGVIAIETLEPVS